MTTNRKRAYSALIVTTLIWGAAFPLIKPAFDYISPMQYLYLRFLVAGFAALPIFIYFYIRQHPKISYLFKVLLIELLGSPLPLLLLYEGLNQTSAIGASLIGATGPIFIILGGIWFLRERQSRREWQGLALSVFGSLILVIEPLLSGNIDTPASAYGNLLIMGYNLLYTVYVIIAKKVYRTKPPLYVGSLTYLLTSLIFGGILLTRHELPSLLLLTSIPAVTTAVFYMAIPGTILCFILYLYALSKIEASEANLFTYLNGVVAIPASYFLLGEVPTFITIVAIVIITLGVYLAERRR